MHTHEKHSTQQHIDEFNQRLAAMAQHQREACALLLEERLRRDVEERNQPALSEAPLWRRAGRWIGQQFTAWAEDAPHTPNLQEPPLKPPDEDAVVIVDAQYRVVEGGGQATTQSTKEKAT